MNISLQRFLPALLALALPLAQTHAEKPPLKIGAAEIDITPPVGHRLAGYFDERLATGVHDPLKAKAIVIQQDREEIALVFCDLIGLSLNVSTNARAQASHKTGIPIDHIVISASHSHTGPLFDDVCSEYFHQTALAKSGSDPAQKIYYPKFLSDRLVKVITQARAKLHPADLEIGIAKQQNLNFNRRYWMKDGKVRFNPGILNTNTVRPAGPIDPDVAIFFAKNPGASKPFAGATIFAMHCDTAGGTLYSADYPYYLQETLRSAFASKYISAFGAGTCGDINHINVNKREDYKGFPVSERIGSALGRTVLGASNDLRVVSNPSFKVLSAFIEAPLQKTTPEKVAQARARLPLLPDQKADFMTKVADIKALDIARRKNPYPMEVQVFRFDADTALVCLPCEIFVELGLAIKQASPFKTTIVQSICNDRPSYVPTKKAFVEGSYEITNARVEPGVGEALVDTAVRLLKEVRN